MNEPSAHASRGRRVGAEYRVVVVHWDGQERGAAHLEDALNEWSAEGWELDFIVPTSANTSIRALVSASASADTTELAVVLRRARSR